MARLRPPDSLRIARSNTGHGLFAGRPFAPGDLILTLRGPRYDRDHPIHGTPGGANLLQTGWRTYILLESPGVFANHSCNPNAGIRGNRRLVAIRRIDPDDEIRFDYSTTMAEDYWTLECSCGDPLCRRQVRDFKYLPQEIQARYLDLGVVQKFIARRYR